ncbi:MAG: RecQ family zinc-binding domain-containing protein, partial [Phaeodactylibacter sp.]|nr:RecQ family zinc-binding domain-containing protein [Phaeodactylibacter sp.]
AQSFPELKEIRRVYQALGSFYQLAVGSHPASSFDFDLVDFARTFQLEPAKTLSALKMLEQAGWIALTDAVYLPASFRIKVSKETLYDYQIRNPKMDGVIKSLLRTHHGAFKHSIHIKEAQLGRLLNQNAGAIRKALELMRQDGIIDYAPAKDEPQLTFIQPRVDTADLLIDQALYNFRKERYAYRIAQVKGYLASDACRTVFMAAYFGEEGLADCGVCDNCLDRKKQGSPDELQSLRQTILQHLKDAAMPMSSRQLLQHFNGRQRDLALEALAELFGEELVEERQGVLYLRP